MSVARFWRESRQRYRIIGNRCTICGKVFFPPRLFCTECHRESMGKMEEFALSGNGVVYSFTSVYSPPEDFAMQRPCIIAIVEMEEGVRILGQIVDASPDEVEIGSEVSLVFRRIREEGSEGVIQYGYKFVMRRKG